jgi:hypothetical protein
MATDTSKHYLHIGVSFEVRCQHALVHLRNTRTTMDEVERSLLEGRETQKQKIGASRAKTTSPEARALYDQMLERFDTMLTKQVATQRDFVWKSELRMAKLFYGDDAVEFATGMLEREVAKSAN